ncbi:tellurite resistance protein TerA [Planomicrobium stackebrandtii]|uniref:Tellurite resistance protein TerA n=1 Tax=Planomicrobium stackebrandtii TaxID=253160 RepID=A0ABU0GWU4_9BACL|nr:TerD family protein [Planomicrobium stackebrandtii]MDQ0429246.1 tellurite resistance protein TerA [Planomicrobium stackebrandtii]
MVVLIKGQKVDLTKVHPGLKQLKIGLGWDISQTDSSIDLDAVALLVDAQGKVAGKENLVFYNNLTGGGTAVQLTKDNQTGAGAGDDEQLTIDLEKIPADIKKVAIAITIYDGAAKKQSFGQVSNAFVRIEDDQTKKELCRFDLGKEFNADLTLLAGEVYLHNGEWKFSAIGQSVSGDIRELCKQFNLELPADAFTKKSPPVKTEAASPKPAAVNLKKVELKKAGDKINLSKTDSPLGEIVVNLNWTQKTGGGFLSSILNASNSVDLDLGCLFELEDGSKGVVQALGNAFGNLKQLPHVALDHDDRTGTSKSGENLRINGDQLMKFKRILVYAFIYEGAANWAEVDGIVTLKQKSGPDVEVRLDEHRKGKRMCAIALIENEKNQTLSVKKVVEYFSGHREMDKAFNWGMTWSAGSK